MSLINQMLQDLELRSSGNLIGGGMQQQVRAVPDRRGVHPAWWIVLVLTLVLVGVVLWFWLRPAPVAATPPFALKIASDLSALPSPAAQAPILLDQAPLPATVPDNVPATTVSTEAPRADIAANIAKKADNPNPSEPKLELAPILKSPAATVKVPASDAASEEPAKAVKLTKQVKELTPLQLAENVYRQAGIAIQLGRSADAITDLEQALLLDPQHAAARQMLVGMLLQEKRTDEAMRRAQEGLSLDPAQFGLAMILARIQVEQNDLKSALATLEHGLPYAVDRADYQAFLAALLQRDKRNKEAIDHYVVALGKSPQNGVWWMGLGISLQAENRLPEAKEAFGRARTSNTLTPELLAYVNQKIAQLSQPH
jgi:MSHA biogenesis protein MshN